MQRPLISTLLLATLAMHGCSQEDPSHHGHVDDADEIVSSSECAALDARPAPDGTCQTSGGGFAPLACCSEPRVHGMLLFGDGPIYVSHLPMYHFPHDHQIVLEIAIHPAPGDGDDLEQRYIDDRRNTGERVYTIAPQPFVLADQPFDQPGFRFPAAIFRGHFERNGTKIAARAEIEVLRLVQSRDLDANEPRPASFRGFLIGDPPEQYILHHISGLPSFDQVVEVGGDSPAEGEIEIAGRADQPLVDGETVDARPRSGGNTFSLQVDSEVYQETGDLSQ